MSDHSNVAIFWDYENCSPPSNSSGLGYDIVNNIRRMARLFGPVTTFRAYLDISVQSTKSVVLRSELQSSGVSMVDCPHNGKKDVVDKMILVDMLAFAIDHPPPATIVLITGDRDYAYAVSILKLRRYQVILVVPSSMHASPALESQASLVIDWGAAILRNRSDLSDSTQAVRQPCRDLDPSLVSELLGELQEDNIAASFTSPQGTTCLRRVSAHDLLEPSKYPTNVGSDDSTPELIPVAASPKKPADVANDSVSSVSAVPKTPERSSHMSISPGSTWARRETSTTQSPSMNETKDPPPSSTTEIRDNVSPARHLNAHPLPPLSVTQPPIHDKSSRGEVPVQITSTTLPSHGLNRFAAPFVTTNAPAGLESTPNPCMVKPGSPIIIPAKTLAGSVSTGDNDGNYKRPNLYRANATDTTKSCWRPSFTSPTMHSPFRKHVGLSPPRSNTPPAEFLGLINDNDDDDDDDDGDDEDGDDDDDDDDDDSAQHAVSSQSSDPQHKSKSNSWSVSSSNSASPPSSASENQGQYGWVRHQKYAMFKTLIRILLESREKGEIHLSRTTIGAELVRLDKEVYQRAGVTRFKRYIVLAEQAGIVELGGNDADAWVALRPSWSRVVGPQPPASPSPKPKSAMFLGDRLKSIYPASGWD